MSKQIHNVHTGDLIVFRDSDSPPMQSPSRLVNATCRGTSPDATVVDMYLAPVWDGSWRRVDESGRDVTKEPGLWDESDKFLRWGQSLDPTDCFLLENDPPEQHGKPIACTQCWNALSNDVERLRAEVTNLLKPLGEIAGLDIKSAGIRAIEIALKALVEFGLMEGGEALKAEADWQRVKAAAESNLKCPNCPTGQMTVQADGCRWCDTCESNR
jgi:hypothetical protein